MKSFLILGGFVGFLIGVAFGLLKEAAWPTILWRASIAALTGGILLRWWGGIWMTGLAQAESQRQDALETSTINATTRPAAGPVIE